MLRRALACLTAALFYTFTVFGPALDMAQASQNALSSPTTGTVTGLQLTANYNSAFDSLNTCNSGASAPTNQLSGTPSAGNCWYNTSTGAVSWYDGANWLTVGYIDATNHVWTPITGGGNPTTVASATTTNLCGSSGASPINSFLTISGTTTITGFGSNCPVGQLKWLTFSGVLQLTYNASSMILPTAASLTTAAGDNALAVSLGSGNWQVLFYQRATGAALSSVGLSIGAAALGNSALSALDTPTNLQLATSVGSNNLTVSVCTINSGSSTCNNASSSNPILIPFRDATAANGDPVIVSLQAALSFTINSGGTMGCVNGQACRLRIYAVNNGGTVGLCAYNSLSGTNIIGLNEGVLQTSASGTNGGSSAQTLYCNISALSGKAVRELGYIEITESTAGTWASNASIIQLSGTGYLKAGAIVQSVGNSTTTPGSSSANNYSPTSTAPTASNTNQIITQAIVPTSAANVLHATAGGTFGGGGTSGTVTAMIWNGSSAVAVSSGPSVGCAGGADIYAPMMSAYNVAGGTSSITYGLYAATNNAGVYWGECGATVFGGTAEYIRIDELMSLLDRPANDNINPGIYSRVG